ncbi:hypothetical protein LshimejAT787_1302330 [Lyophyllum shimeji]|uniref:Uncharacterized protein n=1 Tax=Lyophyllum shimeji TaxID=47721 RepID=A0A9P3USL5_LYOSH|nr:hypothetical protein LshimejAT787_1302330 [Lyophyllum shimeji]
MAGTIRSFLRPCGGCTPFLDFGARGCSSLSSYTNMAMPRRYQCSAWDHRRATFPRFITTPLIRVSRGEVL